MTTNYVRRRDLLLGLGAGAAFLSPFARQVHAQAAGKPGQGKFILFFTPNGHARSDFGSDGNDASFKFRRGMADAASMADHISVVRGLSNKAQHPQRPFHDQISRLMTVKTGDIVGTAMGPSLDQAVADLSAKNPLNLKVYWSRYDNVGTYQNLSWKKAAFPNRNENDPRKAYASVFGDFMPSGGGEQSPEIKLALEQKKSVMDFLKEDISMFKTRLTDSDKSRLDVHLDSVREFEKKLESAPAGSPVGGNVCPMDKAKGSSTYPPPNDSGPYNKEAFKAHGDIQASLLIASLACGARTAGSIIWQGGAGGLNPNGAAGKADDHHEVSHNAAPRDVWISIDNWYAGRYAALLKEAQSVGILDDTVVAWATEITESHSHNNAVFPIAGGKNLGFKHRKSVTFPFVGDENGGRNAARASGNRSLSDLWTTIYKACGGQGNFGEDVAGPINEVWSG